MVKKSSVVEPTEAETKRKALLKKLGADSLLEAYRQMLMIRHFEQRAESAYQQGFVGGFFHSYMGQEAIQVAATQALGTDHWWIGSYRCHALALLLGVSSKDIMAELYGRAAGNAKGRGGSMHLYADRLLGGFGIVGGQVPIAIGAAFSLKYQGKKDQVALCFLGDGAVAQGAFHESVNQASLLDLPCIFVIENNQWGMGTAVDRAQSVKKLAEDKAVGYGINGYSFDGMDYFTCYEAFSKLYKEVTTTSRPVLAEFVTERFRGHSISDPGLYRSKEDLKKAMKRDPIALMQHALEEEGILSEESFKQMNDDLRQEMIDAMKYAEDCPWPDPVCLEEDVFAP